jgi:BlaI family penicillinase repressor
MREGRARLGQVQLRIIRVLWEKGEATAREITDQLCVDEMIAHSTVQTLLRQMEAKGSVMHRTHERTFVFRPVAAEEEVRTRATSDLLSRFFAGSVSGLVSHLLKQESVPPDEIARLRELIDREDPS